MDTSTGAVILSDYGSVHFVGNSKGWFDYVYQRHTRIQILNKKAFDQAKVEISVYAGENGPEKAENFAGSTYNLDNGTVSETRLDKKDVFEDREDKNYIKKKFTLPAVREGSIIEYSYSITSSHVNTLPSWEFQSDDDPCLYSEYEVEIPQAMFYVVVKQGVHPYDLDKGGEGHASYLIKERNQADLSGSDQTYTATTTTTKHRWAIKNIPPLKDENYLSTPRNYVDKIGFQMAKWYDGRDYHDETNTWAKATEEL
ncbi:MAG TPA: DUF3857 domain-containing protein, partial [Puia sp.]